MKHVEIHTDGACLGNPGPGGWGALLRYGETERELAGGESDTTNNRMELMAAIVALEALSTACEVTLHTDSQYVQKGIGEWLPNWIRRGWKTAAGEPVKNQDLWERLLVAPRPAHGELALGARPLRPCRQRARGQARARRRRNMIREGHAGLMRQVVLDTETTGLSWERGNRVVEIGCIELLERRPTGQRFQRYLNPGREIEPGAQEVTGLTLEFLSDKPRFAQVADEFLDFIRGAELIIHNADFDVGFLDNELGLLGAGYGRIRDHAERARYAWRWPANAFPGQRNSLDALCRRMGVDNAHRKLHGALLDAELLAEVYLALTAGQGDLGFSVAPDSRPTMPSPGALAGATAIVRRRLLLASAEEQEAHQARLEKIARKCAGNVLWTRQQAPDGMLPH